MNLKKAFDAKWPCSLVDHGLGVSFTGYHEHLTLWYNDIKSWFTPEMSLDAFIDKMDSIISDYKQEVSDPNFSYDVNKFHSLLETLYKNLVKESERVSKFKLETLDWEKDWEPFADAIANFTKEGDEATISVGGVDWLIRCYSFKRYEGYHMINMTVDAVPVDDNLNFQKAMWANPKSDSKEAIKEAFEFKCKELVISYNNSVEHGWIFEPVS